MAQPRSHFGGNGVKVGSMAKRLSSLISLMVDWMMEVYGSRFMTSEPTKVLVSTEIIYGWLIPDLEAIYGSGLQPAIQVFTDDSVSFAVYLLPGRQ